MKLSNIRTIIASVIFVVLAIGLIAGVGMGTLSGFGWDTISALCPLGAFEIMLANLTFIPRGIISIVVMGVLVLIFGRVFCAYICPVDVLTRARNGLSSAKKRLQRREKREAEMTEIANYEISKCTGGCATCSSNCKPQKHHKLDSRHFVLGGALLSSLIFGFPVFCLVCPIGLSFATVLLFWRLFAFGDTTISCILVPVMLIIEVVFLRKWCGRFCPMSALMNLVSRFTKTFRPTIDNEKCLETTTGKACSRCAIVCPSDINLRHPEYGEHTLADCSRCRTCVDNCPTHAITMPIFPKKGKDDKFEVKTKKKAQEG